MRTGLAQFTACATLALMGAATAVYAQPGGVQQVSVRVELASEAASGGAGVGVETMGQLEEALTETVSLALLDQLDGDLEYITQHQSAVAETLGEVINSALAKRGFVLEELSLEPGTKTQVLVRLRLASERVEEFNVSFSLLGDTPVIRAVVAEDEDSVAAALYSTLARTPVGDVRWLGGLVGDTVETRLAGLPAYADFEHVVTVKAGTATQVMVAFTPKSGAQALSGSRLHLRSLTLLNSALQPLREQLAHVLIALHGAPLSFITPKLPELQQALYQYLVNQPLLAPHCADAKFVLRLRGCALEAEAAVDSARYVTGLNARLALWEYTPRHLEGRIEARAGAQFGGGWAALAAGSFFPGEGELYPMFGVARLIDHDALLALGWDFKAEGWRALGELSAGPQVYFTGDAITGSENRDASEIAVHYRIRDIYELQLGSNFEGEVFAALAAEF